MKEKNILITGGSQGIGAKTAEYLSSQGATIILVARNEQKLRKMQRGLPGTSFAFSYDLQNLKDIENIFQYCLDNKIKLHGMVHCAGINRDIPVKYNDIDMMKETFAVNYMAFVELGKYFMKKKYSADGGSIVAISSSAANTLPPGMCTYASSKLALEGAVKIMAKEFLKRKIRVNAIAPSCVDTEMIDNAPFINVDDIEMTQPLGLIEPIYISYLIEYLISEKSKYITGTTIPVYAGAV